MKHHPQSHTATRPQQRTCKIKQQKRRQTHAHSTCHRRRKCRQTWDEFRQQQSRRTRFGKTQFAFAHTGIGRNRNLTHQRQNALAIAAARVIPQQIRHQRCQRSQHHSQQCIHRAVGVLRTRQQQKRIRRNRRAHLLHKYRHKQCQQAMGLVKSQQRRHGSPTFQKKTLLYLRRTQALSLAGANMVSAGETKLPLFTGRLFTLSPRLVKVLAVAFD